MAVDVDKVESTLYVPFKKFEEQPDGSVMVYGLASGPDTDLDGQRMDPEWLKKAMPEWLVFGNIREMHQPKAVGKAKEYQWTDEGPYIASKIIDPDAVKKVKEGVYGGYSIGVKNAVVVPDTDAPKGLIKDGQIVEVSVVDFPAYPKAKFSLVKAAQSGGWQDMQTGVVLEKDADVDAEAEPDTEKAVLSGAEVDDLPDSAFAYISPGGKKDKEGKTTPRSLRHLPYKNAEGKLDAAHIRNALARLSQTDIPDEAKAKAKKKLDAAAKKLGIDSGDNKGKGVNKMSDTTSPDQEEQDAGQMQEALEDIQSVQESVEELIEQEQSEVDAGDADDVQDVNGLKQTLESLAQAIQALQSVFQHESGEAEKVLDTGAGLAAYNQDGNKPKKEKAINPEVKKVGRKMSKANLDRMSQMATSFKDIAAQFEQFCKELGDFSMEGGEKNNEPDNPGGEPLEQTVHKPPNVGDDKGVPKDAGSDLLAKTISDAITMSLAKAGVIKSAEQPKQEQNDALNTILEKFNAIDKRLQRIENQPAAPEVEAMVVDKGHALNADTKKNYQSHLSTLAQQVTELNDKERENLAAELIKAINGR